MSTARAVVRLPSASVMTRSMPRQLSPIAGCVNTNSAPNSTACSQARWARTPPLMPRENPRYSDHGSLCRPGPDRLRFEHDGAQPLRRAINRGRQASGPGTDNRQVIVLRHGPGMNAVRLATSENVGSCRTRPLW